MKKQTNLKDYMRDVTYYSKSGGISWESVNRVISHSINSFKTVEIWTQESSPTGATWTTVDVADHLFLFF
jgi:hypothetical protein